MTGRQYRRLRESIGTQKEVAKMLEVAKRTIQRWEASKRVPKLGELATLQVAAKKGGR